MKKNKRVILLLSVLILGIGVSLAYFVGKTIFKGTGATTEGRTATVNGSTLDISGNINFGDIDIYPGHQTLSKVTATATGNNELIAYNLTWVGTNNLNTNLKYKVYVSDIEKEIELTCEKKKKVVNGAQQLNEVCTSNIEELGEPINEGEIPKLTEEQTIKITDTEFITSKEEGAKKYYYIIVEYPDNGNQSIDIGNKFEGKVYGEISNTKADINLVAFYKETEEGKYEEVEEIPDNNYILNQEETKCNNEEVKVRIENNEIILSNVSKSGTACYLYFSKPTADKTLLTLNLKSNSIDEGCPSEVEPTINLKYEGEGLLCKGKDNEGDTYYFRGNVTNNWIKFADLYWRIIRINSNGSIRLIYNGATTKLSGVNTQLNNETYEFNSKYEDNAYLGYMYGNVNQPKSELGYNNTHSNINDSEIKKIIDLWYKTAIDDKKLTSKLDINAGFCGDRTPYDGYTSNSIIDKNNYGVEKTTTYYGGYIRVFQKHQPMFSCLQKNDLYTNKEAITGNKSLIYPVGLISADEVMYAGGFGANNDGYWLYTNQTYWTMSPSHYGANMITVSENGALWAAGITYSFGVRPVINLKADTTFTFTDGEDIGTSSNPYIVQ